MADDQSERGMIGTEANVRLIRRAWDVLYRRPHLLAWRILGDVAGMVVRPLGFLAVLLASSVGLVLAGWNPESPAALIEVARRVDPARLVVGIVGVVATVGLGGLTVDALVRGGIWSAISRDLRNDRDDGDDEVSFAEDVLEGFPPAFQLAVVGVAIQWTLFLLFGTLAVAVGSAFVGGQLWAGPVWLQVAMLALPLFCYLVLGALARLVLEVAAPAMFLEDVGIGRAFGRAAHFAVTELASLYRILARAFGYLLVPLFGFWGFSLIANAVEGPPAVMAVVQAGRVGGQILTTVAFALITLLLQSALFTFWAAVHADEAGGVVDLTAADDEEDDDATGQGWDATARLADLVPDRTPYVGSVD